MQRLSVWSSALLYVVAATTAAAVAQEPPSPWWIDGFFDPPPTGGPFADRHRRPADDFRQLRVVDHKLGRPKRSSDTMYWDSPDASYRNLFSSSCSDYSLWAKSSVAVLVVILCVSMLVCLIWCCRNCCCSNAEHGYCDMKCNNSHCAFSSVEQ